MLIRSKTDLGAQLRSARKKQVGTLSQASLLSGLREGTISDIENGNTNTKIDTIFKLFALYSLDLQIISRKSADFDPTDY